MITTEQTPERITVKLTQPPRAENAEAMRRALHEAVADHDAPVTLDLSEVNEMDTPGLTVLLGCYQTLSADDRELAIVTNNEDIQTLLNAMGLEEDFALRGT